MGLFSYLREDDQVPTGTRVPTEAERITRRGPETLREWQEASMARRPKPKGKKKMHIPERVEKELSARMRGLETTQLEIRQDIQSLRTDVQGVHTLS
ncbi:hypothetical protein OROGR_027339 [Orobanche gracilis]